MDKGVMDDLPAQSPARVAFADAPAPAYKGRIDERGQCTELRRVVEGALAFTVTFMGPTTYKIGDTPYVTLCSHGIKPEGAPTQCYGWAEAIELYGEQLRRMVAENKGKQLAWRRLPALEGSGPGAKFYVSSRLAFI